MSTPISLHRPLTALAAAALILFGLGSPASAIDDNATKQIWKLKYGVLDAQINEAVPYPLWLSKDDDGDGLKNGDECAAGTNPFKNSSTVKVSSVVKNGANAELQFPTQSGKRYRVESSSPLGGAWTLQPQPTPVQVIGDGTVKMLAVLYSANTFYRVRVDDVDTDGEGVSDWAELAVTLDPGDQTTEVGVNDLDYVNEQIALPSAVSIEAVESFATEDGPVPGKLTVTRTQNLFPVTVNLNVTGTASPGADYTALPASVPFAARGAMSIDLMVDPIVPQAQINGSRSVTAAITVPVTEEFPVSLGTPSSATVIIKDTTAPTGTGLRARYYNTASSTYANSNNFNAAQLKIDRVDPVVDNDWGYGTPNGVVIAPNPPNSPDNYSDVFETYLSPTTAGNYQFQLDADDKARVLLDLNNNGVFDLPGEQIVEHGWDTSATGSPVDGKADDEVVGTFKLGITLAGSSTTAGSATITVPSTDGLVIGMAVTGTGLPANEFITAIGSGQITVTTGTGVTAQAITTLTAAPVFALAVPGSPALRYRMRVEHVETTGDARCRLQWRAGTAAFANIPQANQFTHTQTMLDYTVASAVLTVNTDAAHGLNPSDPVRLWFNSGLLFSTGNYNSSDTVSYSVLAVVDADTFTVSIPGAPDTSGDGFVGNATSTTTGVLNQCYANTTFTNPPGRVGVDAAVTTGNNGIWGSGTPDVALIVPDTFSIRWTGQMQPQFTEEYTIAVHADDGCRLWINGQEQEFRQSLSVNVGGATYSYDGGTGDTVVTYSGASIAADSFAVGDVVRLDPRTGSLSTLGTLDYVVSAATSTTFTVNFGTGTFATDTGTLDIDALNRVIKPWASNGNERFVRIPLIGGTRYDIQLDYYENTSFARSRLFWFSPSQPKEIIPTNRLYPDPGVVQAPPAHLTQTDATALVGGPFSLAVLGSNLGTVSFGSTLPGWLTYNIVSGLLSGTPGSGDAGDYQIIVTITNADGTSTSVINLHVEDTDGDIVREYWNGVAGTSVADIPVGNAPTGTNILTSLQAATNTGDDYGARLRGYITAPETGNYYFWVSASNAAELWISNDDEPISAFKRAWVTTGNATPQTWTGEPNQKSPWMALEQGKKYYIEVLHKAGTGAGDNLAIGWSKPGQSETAPSQIVPGFVLSRYVEPAPGSTPGTLYLATMLSQAGAMTNGVGSSNLRLSEDENVAYMKYTYSNLTGPITSQHIHTDPYLNKASTIVFDIDTPETPGDGLITNPTDPNFGAYKWTITPKGTLTKADIIEIIKQGKAYINLHTAMYPNGEIRGNYAATLGSRTFTPPPAPPAWTDDSGTNDGASRFLTQASYGASTGDITALKALTATAPVPAMPGVPASRYNTWIDDQFTKSPSQHLDEVIRTEFANAQGGAFDETLSFNAWWWRSITGDDQLRQRVAFALSQIHVVSGQGPLDNRADAISYFYDKLLYNAFGNFRDILEDTTLTPSMGRYLDMLRNDKPDLTVGRIPNENYAREIKQLFSVGLFRMWPDGTLMLTSKDAPIDVYTQREIVGFAHVFTGWDYGYDGAYRTALNAPVSWVRQMREVPARHYTGTKRILNNEVLPGLRTVGSQPLDPLATHNSMVFNDPDYQALAGQELEVSHDQLFNHPNVGPFICRQLIQRLVTSSPSRGYLYRVAQKFDDNGSGVRGDMKAVIKAILLDFEARDTSEAAKAAYGKQREPVLRVASAARAFRVPAWSGTYTQIGTRTITIDTSAPHKQVSGNSVFLDFTSGSPAPWIGLYSVASVVDSDTFTVNAQGWATGTYNIPAGSTTCTVTMNSHWLGVGNQFFMDFTSGTADASSIDNQVYPVATVGGQSSESPPSTFNNGTSFTFTVPSDAAARTGNCMIPRFNPGSYTTASSGLPAPNDRRVTMDTNWDHHLNPGDVVQLNFYGGNPQPVDMVVTVETVVDLNTWTFLGPSAGTNLSPNQGFNSVYQFPLLSQPLTRSGNVGSRPSTFAMGNTDLDIDQTPLNSPTVFNFYLPDYKFPGTLAAQGITTPEFQETAETSVIRQANFLFNSIYYPINNVALASFKTGSNALMMDFSPWIGNATDAGLGAGTDITKPWTDDVNLDALIDRLNTLLMAGKLPANAKTLIKNHVLTLTRGRQISNLGTNAAYTTVTTPVAHNLVNGNSVTLSGITGGTFTGSINATHVISNVTSTTFRVPIPYTNSTGVNFSNGRVSTSIAYSNGGTSPDADKRDRLNAIIQLILTSPDFTIQR